MPESPFGVIGDGLLTLIEADVFGNPHDLPAFCAAIVTAFAEPGLRSAALATSK
jgi:hypothetical protein